MRDPVPPPCARKSSALPGRRFRAREKNTAGLGPDPASGCTKKIPPAAGLAGNVPRADGRAFALPKKKIPTVRGTREEDLRNKGLGKRGPADDELSCASVPEKKKKGPQDAGNAFVSAEKKVPPAGHPVPAGPAEINVRLGNAEPLGSASAGCSLAGEGLALWFRGESGPAARTALSGVYRGPRDARPMTRKLSGRPKLKLRVRRVFSELPAGTAASKRVSGTARSPPYGTSPVGAAMFAP